MNEISKKQQCMTSLDIAAVTLHGKGNVEENFPAHRKG